MLRENNLSTLWRVEMKKKNTLNQLTLILLLAIRSMLVMI